MLTVKCENDNCKHKLTMEGHCASAPKGEDLVCAAASILAQTMAQVLEENEDKLVSVNKKINEGDVVLEWEAKPEYEPALRNVLYGIMTGFKLLYYNEPDYIIVQ